jgi:hypothetical protein
MEYLQRNVTNDAIADYLAGRVNRREFLCRLALISGGSMVGFSLLGSLACGSPATTATPPLRSQLLPCPPLMKPASR